MANELTLSGSVVYEDSLNQADSLGISDFIASSDGQLIAHLSQLIGTDPKEIELGGVEDIGYAIFVNRDPTNTIHMQVGDGGAKFARLLPAKGFCILYMGDDAQVPFAYSTTAPSKQEYFLVST